jgi:glycosyltransferase involved in cell wall biosynthesis
MFLYTSQKLSIIFVHSHVFAHNLIDDFIDKGYMTVSDNTVLFVSFSWYYPRAIEYIDRLLNTEYFPHENMYMLLNSPEEVDLFKVRFPGRHVALVNNAAWIDTTAFDCMESASKHKVFDAVLNAKAESFKNHHLAALVPELCCISGGDESSVDELYSNLKPSYLNNSPLLFEDIAYLINKSTVAMMLSEEEGACYASAEYLACGVPVVSTPSRGGRHMFYNDKNSIICEATPEGVAKAVAEAQTKVAAGEFSAVHIREQFMMDVLSHQKTFTRVLQEVFDRFGVTDCLADEYFKENFRPKFKDLRIEKNIPCLNP